MQEPEVIIVNGISQPTYKLVVEKALRYALISIPFTYNRMRLESLQQKITNIAKGKVAEFLFRFFCIKNNIDADFHKCTTPFYMPDKRDFVANDYEWDLKNNFIYHKHNLPDHQLYTNLPALIPASYNGDQWSKRDVSLISGTKGVRYLFTFMKNLDHREKHKNFLQLQLTQKQDEFIGSLCKQFHGLKLNKAPFTDEWFFEKLEFQSVSYNIIHYPHLVITGYAGNEHWHLFKEAGTDVKKYCNGLLVTRINNRMTEVKNLPSFISLYPQLREKIRYATLRSSCNSL